MKSLQPTLLRTFDPHPFTITPLLTLVDKTSPLVHHWKVAHELPQREKELPLEKNKTVTEVRLRQIHHNHHSNLDLKSSQPVTTATEMISCRTQR